MNKCKSRRYNDEHHCSCGITWGVNEEKPPCRPASVKIKDGPKRVKAMADIGELFK